MDILNNSNQSSALNAVLKDAASEKNPFLYEYASDFKGCSLSGISRTLQDLSASNAVSYGSSTDFQISKAGLMRGIVIKVTTGIKNASGSSQTPVRSPQAGLQVLERVQLVSQGRVVSEITRESLGSACAYQPKNSRDVLKEMMALDAPVIPAMNNNTQIDDVFRIPVLMSCFTNINEALDTNFVAPLVLRVFLAPYDQIYTTKASCTEVAPTMKATVEYIRESSSMAQARIGKEFAEGGSSQRLQYNWEHLPSTTKDSVTVADGMSHEIKTNNFISEMYVYLSKSASPAKGEELGRIVISSNGQTICDVDAELLLQWAQDSDSPWWSERVPSKGATASFAHRYRYTFSLTDDLRRLCGGASTRELSNFKVHVYPKADLAAGSNATVHVCLRFAQMLSIEASSGKITTSVSS